MTYYRNRLISLCFCLSLALYAALAQDIVPDSLRGTNPQLCAITDDEAHTPVEKIDSTQFARLTEKQMQKVANELGVEVAAIKAVCDIEAGKTHEGFWGPYRPIINYDCTIFINRLKRKGVDIEKQKKRYPEVFQRINIKKYGSRSRAQYARLEIASRIDRRVAYESTFWGMFQIGGFNWKKCGCDSLEHFVALMSESEDMQLELFARFLRSNNLVKHLKNKNWKAFARIYNGPTYARRRYHTRLAAAYAKHKRTGK